MMFLALKKHFPSRIQEWFSAIVLTSWGAYVILHPGIFSNPPLKFAMRGLLDLFDEPVWGLGAFTTGFLGLIALYINGIWTRTPLIRLCVSFARIFFWFWITMGLWRSGVAQLGVVLYPWLMVLDVYSSYRASVDVVEAEAQRRMDKVIGSHKNVTSLRGE